jgi:hypothetical protein
MAYIIDKNGECLHAESCQCGYDRVLLIRKFDRGATVRLMCPSCYHMGVDKVAKTVHEALEAWNKEQETWKEFDEIS